MSVNWFISYFSANMVEVLFSVALVTLVYSIARILKARPSIALAFAFSPLLLAWSYQSASTQNLIFAFL